LSRVSKIIATVLLLAIADHGTPAVLQAKSAKAAHLGANLPRITDWSFTPVYADLMNQARRFGSAAAPWDESAILGDDGWPKGDFGVVLMIGASKYSGNAGTYKVSFNGRAKVSPIASGAKVSRQHFDSRQNRSSADVLLTADEDQLMLSFTDTGPGIKNVKVMRPGYDSVKPPLFTKAFLNHIARFKTLRFMEWLRTNNNPVTSWAMRASPEKTHYASKAGVPWEHIIALVNQTHQDIWINIPAAADDDYVLQLAKLLKTSLESDCKIYLEYSNEIWNGGFEQYNINRTAAIQEVQNNPKSLLAYDGNTKPQTIAFRRVARRLKEISDIFRTVYGDAAMMRIIRPVFSSQIVQPLTAKVGLEFVDALYGPPNRYFYALAGAPYFNLGSQQTAEGLTSEQVLNAMQESINRLPTVNALESNVALASWYGMKFFAYEGGSDTFGPGSLAAKKTASLNPRMLDICTNYLASWYRQGGDMLMWFMAGAGNWDSQYGTWELSTDVALTDAPKVKCMDKILGSPPAAPKGRNEVPGTFDALAFVGNQAPYSASSASRLRYLHPGSSLDYLVLAPAAGTYSLHIRAEAARSGNTIDLAVNSTIAVSTFELAASGWGKPVDNQPIKLDLKKGFNTLRLTTKTENLGFSMSALTIH
jgi:hypothetical protein